MHNAETSSGSVAPTDRSAHAVMRKDHGTLWAGGSLWTQQWRDAKTGSRATASDWFERALDHDPQVTRRDIRIISFHQWRAISDDDAPRDGDVFYRGGEAWLMVTHKRSFQAHNDPVTLMVCVTDVSKENVQIAGESTAFARDIREDISDMGFEPAGFTSEDLLWTHDA